jgi:hypothetical protein
MKEKIYNIVLKDIKDKMSLIDDMKKDSGDEYIPEKKCLALNNTNLQRRVLSFRLTEEEAKKLEKDPRVEAIQQKIPYKIKPLILDPNRDYGEEKNIRMQAAPSDAVAAIYRIPTGEDVDVVVVDGHIDPNNPEFALRKDGTGGSRVNQIDWFNVLYPYGVPDNFWPYEKYKYEPYVNPDNYLETESNDHGAHVGGTIAGNTQGWVPKANIYNISPYHQEMIDNRDWRPDGAHDLYLHAIKVWHQNKPVNIKKGTKNPTITNHSYGVGIGGIDVRNIIDVTYRGVKYTSTRNYSGATATTTVDSGKVVSGAITNQGKNYTNEPTVSFYGGGQARAKAPVGNGTIYEITITDPGEGYPCAACERYPTAWVEWVPITFSPAPAGGQTARGRGSIRMVEGSGIYYIEMQNRGSGYTTPPTITFPPPPNGGRTAQATCKIKSGVLNEPIVNNGGSGYLNFPEVILSGGNPSTPAQIGILAFEDNHTDGDLSTIKNGDIFIEYYGEPTYKIVQDNINGTIYERYVVESIKYTWSCGEGYTSDPIVSFYGGNSVVNGVKTGNKAEARAVLGTGVNQGKIIGINITHQGSGYTSPPNVVFTNGGGFSKEQLNNFGLISYAYSDPLLQGKRFIDIGIRAITMEADLTDLMNSGVVVVGAAGNNSTKIDVPGGPDYDNKLNVVVPGFGWYLPEGVDPIYFTEFMYETYYHRGSSPTACPNVISVGSLSRLAEETKNTWSNTGPRVDVYSPGDMIASTTHSIFPGYPSIPDIRSIGKPITYYVSKLSGTSMASPQVCGMIASHATTNRNINQLTAIEFIRNTSRNTVNDTGGSYSDLTSLLGGANRSAYFPNISYTLYS